MSLFLKKPACRDLGYVINVRTALKNSYSEEYNIYSPTRKDRFVDFTDFKIFFSEIESFFNVKLELTTIDKIEGFYDNLPIVYNVIQDQDDNITIGITPFGLSNLDVLFCEILLYLIDHKIISDGFIHFEEEFFNDYENSYRPFLVMASVFFGFGHLLLKRFWVSGIYKEDTFSIEVLEYKYYIPLDVNILIFAICYEIYCSGKSEKELLEITSDFSREIKKEIIVCFSFLEKKGKSLIIESVNPFYWKSAENR